MRSNGFDGVNWIARVAEYDFPLFAPICQNLHAARLSQFFVISGKKVGNSRQVLRHPSFYVLFSSFFKLFISPIWKIFSS
jgi:hypothetical protein